MALADLAGLGATEGPATLWTVPKDFFRAATTARALYQGMAPHPAHFSSVTWPIWIGWFVYLGAMIGFIFLVRRRNSNRDPARPNLPPPQVPPDA